MATIKYTFADGHTEEVEVSEEFKFEYERIEQQSRRNDEKFDWRARKKETSFEKLHEDVGLDIPDTEKPIDEQVIDSDFILRFTELLTDRQKEIFRKVYKENKPLRMVSKELNIRLHAVQKHLAGIHKKFLKNFFENGGQK